MSMMRSIFSLIMVSMMLIGCGKKPQYGTERQLNLPTARQQIWAIAPAVNISGQTQVDPLLQADLVFEQLQQVHGLTVVPVNRVVEVYSSLRIEMVQSEEQAALVCDMLGCDALLVPTVSAYDPYNPPKFGASLQLFSKPGGFSRTTQVDPRELSRQASPGNTESLSPAPDFLQAVGIYDAANGSVRNSLAEYVHGRHDPSGALGAKEYLVSMDRYCGFVYHELIGDLLRSPRWRRA
jgi:hypothetical protein